MASRRSQESMLRRLGDAEITSILSTSDWGSALAVLWDRHAGLLYSTARSLCRNDDDARDAMSEALAKIAQRASDGSLSVETSFKSYAVMVVRNASHDVWRRTGRVDVTDDVDVDASSGSSFLPDPVLDDLDERYVATAFAQLPERYRQVLWLVEVEGLPPREVAELLSMTPNNVSQIAVRARTALREGWAAAHLAQLDTSSPCHEFAQHLPAFAAGSLAAARIAPLESHLASCASCSGLNQNLMADTMKLRGLALPIPVVLTFRYLRDLAGGAAQSTAQSAGVFAQTADAVQRFAGAIQALVTTGQNALVVGVGAVAAVATIGVGTYAITNVAGDRSRDSDRTEEIIEGTPSDGTIGEIGPDVSATTVPSETTTPTTIPETTVVPSSTLVPSTTTPPSTTEAPNRRNRSSSPGGTLVNDSAFTLGFPIAPYSSRSWTYQGSAGSKVALSNTAGAVMYLSPPLPTSAGLCVSICGIESDGSYTVTLYADSELIPGTTQVMISADTVELSPNALVEFDPPLPKGLVRLFRFEATVGDVFALGGNFGWICDGDPFDGLSNCARNFGAALFDSDGSAVCSDSICTAMATGSYTVCAGFGRPCGNISSLPGTESLVSDTSVVSAIQNGVNGDTVTLCGLSEFSPACGHVIEPAALEWVGVFEPTETLQLNVPLEIDKAYRSGEPFLADYEGTANEFVAFGSTGLFQMQTSIIDVPDPGAEPLLEFGRRDAAILPIDGRYVVLVRPTQEYAGYASLDLGDEVEIGGAEGPLSLTSPHSVLPSDGPIEVLGYTTTDPEIVRILKYEPSGRSFYTTSLWTEDLGEASQVFPMFFGTGSIPYLLSANSNSYLVTQGRSTSGEVVIAAGGIDGDISLESPVSRTWSGVQWLTKMFRFDASAGQEIAFSGPSDVDRGSIHSPTEEDSGFNGRGLKCLPVIGPICSDGPIYRIPESGEYLFAPYYFFPPVFGQPSTWDDPLPEKTFRLYTIGELTLDETYLAPFTVSDGNLVIRFDGSEGQRISVLSLSGITNVISYVTQPFDQDGFQCAAVDGLVFSSCVLPRDDSYYLVIRPQIGTEIPMGTSILLSTPP